MENKTTLSGAFFVVILAGILLSILYAGVGLSLMLFWNLLIAPVFSLPSASFLQGVVAGVTLSALSFFWKGK